MPEFDKYVAVVGCGYWGKNLVRNFASLGVLRVVCDASLETLSKCQKEYGVEAVTDFQSVLDMPDVQAVVIATPAATHASLAIQTLAAGKDVFVEKPLALTLSDALTISEKVTNSGCILMVGHLLEYHPALVKLRAIVASGKIGQLQYLYSNRLSLGKVRTEENVLWSFAPHDISSILGFVGRLPTSVQAVGSAYLGNNSDFCTVNLCFEQNINAHIFVSWLHPFKEHRLVVVGESGTLVFDDVSVDAKLTLYSHSASEVDNMTVLKKNAMTVIPIDAGEPLKLECEHFLRCVQTRQTPRTSLKNGIDVLRVLDSAQVSLENLGQIVYLKEAPVVHN